MRYLKLVVAIAGLLAGSAVASPANPAIGAEYVTLASPQAPQADGKKIEVIEFFMYHCPACNAIEPELAAWVKKHGDTVHFRRIHLPHGTIDPEAHLFLTLEAMGKEDALHASVMQAWHVDHHRLKDDADNLDWALKNGLDKAKFQDAYNSFGVTTKLRNLTRLANNYAVNSTPTLVIDGRYQTNPSMVETSNRGLPRDDLARASMQVVDALVAKAASEKK
ncbi:MAG: thiol:disulfide interchange protein DsbA/DsbL [Pseudomonadota bacterium]